MRYGDSAELAATIAEEGGNSPADVFFAQDAGSLGAVDARARAASRRRRSTGSPRVSATAKAAGSGRRAASRVLAYNTDPVTERPARLRVRPHRPALEGQARDRADERVVPGVRDGTAPHRRRGARRSMARGPKQNEPSRTRRTRRSSKRVRPARSSSGSSTTTTSTWSRRSSQTPRREPLPRQGDPGALVNVAGAGILASAEQPARRPSSSSTSCSPTRAQRFYADEAEEAEYPLVAGIPARTGLPPLDELQGPDVDLSTFGAELERDARAAARDRLPVVSRRSGRRAPPAPARPRGGLVVVACSCCRSPTW